ncbi:MAG: PqqD family protein [Candidatus Omnitrophica bacterium]|nr:PqqD family protein [Candidatus Omnitrophota bacterium]
MLKLDEVYVKEQDSWVSRHILDEVVIMPLCRSADDMQYIYSISNETGSRIWQLLDGDNSTWDIQETIKSEYQGQFEVIEREVLGFLKDLSEAGLIRKARIKPKTENLNPKPEIKKKPYKSPEIAKVKLQPEQAVLSCCTINGGYKGTTVNRCAGLCPIDASCNALSDQSRDALAT